MRDFDPPAAPANAAPLPQQLKAAEQVRLDGEHVKPELVARRIEAAKFDRGLLCHHRGPAIFVLVASL